MSTDALAYAHTINFLTASAELSELANKIQGVYKFSTGTTNLDQQAQANLNKILDKTQIKRACCNATSSINVRIPLPTGITPSSGPVGELVNEFQYYDKLVNIPIKNTGFCTVDGVNYAPESTDCDDFYQTYCSNMINEFTAGNSGGFNGTSFLYYKPECACYIPTPTWLTQAWGGDPIPKCVFPGCGANTTSYLDPVSRSSQCDYTICNQQINMSGIQQGADSSIINNIQAECGTQGKNPFVGTTQPEAAPTGSSPPSGTTGPTTTPEISTSGTPEIGTSGTPETTGILGSITSLGGILTPVTGIFQSILPSANSSYIALGIGCCFFLICCLIIIGILFYMFY